MNVIRKELIEKSPLCTSLIMFIALSCGCTTTDKDLVPPAQVEFCITSVVPSNASVSVDGKPLEVDGCNLVTQGPIQVTATAPGYAPLNETVVAINDPTSYIIQMTPI